MKKETVLKFDLQVSTKYEGVHISISFTVHKLGQKQLINLLFKELLRKIIMVLIMCLIL